MKHFHRYLICVVVLLLMAAYPHVDAQPVQLKGVILDGVTRKAVENGLVINYSRDFNIYSNPRGEFIVEVNQGDTLVFSAVGYYYQKAIVTDSLLKASLPLKFMMSPRVYEISEARIVALGTYDEFKQKFIHLDKPKTETEILTEKLADLSHKAAKEAYDMAQANRKRDGITLLSIPIRSPEEKERIALAKIMEKEKIRDQIYQKFNPEVIKKVTGLTTDHDIIEFMVFCDFSDKYLLDVNEYDLMVQIAQKFEAYKRKKQSDQSDDNPVNLNHRLFNPNA
jgi:hypothetical protein